MRWAAPILLFALSGCATIVNGRYQTVPVTSDPAGATVHVQCGNAPSDGGVTPTSVKLRRSATTCALTLSKSGFADHTVTFQRVTSGWFYANIAFPGLLAEVAVEAATGPKFSVFGTTSNKDQVNGVGLAGGTALGMLLDHSTGAQYTFKPKRVDAKLDSLGR